MSINELSEQLENLQEELACLRAAEQHTRDEIESVLDAIRKELDEQDNGGEHDADIQNFTNYLHRFETQHPELTASVNRIMVTLGNMGI